ncbi:MAG: hypothetical protein LCH37_09945 [Bacteroidetes bacterium]|nr:hypothetical protein [Bacteroidota bacterium]MCK6610916.1 hypothetical protein [Bacteroidia bacterium]
MDRWILRNWLILSIASLAVGFWIAFFEHFVKDKAYMFFILAIVFFITWLKKSGKL